MREKMMTKVQKTEEQWRAELEPEQYRVLREKGTEAPFSGEYDHTFEPGTYRCAGCGAELFRSETKYDSGCGWPAFYAPAGEEAVDEETDTTYGMVRTEVTCSNCGGHLGHVFPDGPRADRHALLHQLGSTQPGGGIVEKKATFGAGCFWGVEAAFRQLDGVTRTRVGYAGGTAREPDVRGCLLAHDRARRGRRGDVRPRARLVRAAARRVLAQARPDPAESPGLGHRRPVPLGDLLPRRGAAARLL